MLTKTSRKQFLEKYPHFAQSDYRRDKYVFPDVVGSYVLFVEAQSTIGRCNSLAKEITRLMDLLGYNNLSFMGDTTTPWLFRNHDYKPVKRALEYLAEHNISKTFNGAVNVDIKDVSELIKNLFWLIRCNGIVMNVNFSDPDFNIMASICQYGNLHINTLNAPTNAAFMQALAKAGLHILPDGACSGERIYKRKGTYTLG